MIAINLKNKEKPQGWKICVLPDFTHLEMGQSPPSTTYNHESVGLPFFQGKAEFGPRALGNRSILADPRNFKTKNILNDIKDRA